MTGAPVFRHVDERLGEFAIRPVDPVDARRLHRWLTHPKSVFWQLQDADLAEVARMYEVIAADPARDAYIGMHRGRPAFLVERYDPRVSLADVYPGRLGDIGMHFLVAPAERPIHGFTRAVIVVVMELLFADPAVRRVVVEPDVRNEAVQILNAYVGFEVLDTVSLPGKDAYLSVCTRARYRATRGAGP